MTNGFSFVTQHLVELSKDGINLLLSGDKSLRYRLNQKSYLVESGGNMDKKQRDLNEFVDSHESKIDWFNFVTPEKAREILSDLDNHYTIFENKYGWKLSDKAKEIIVARLSEIAKKNNTFNLKINIDLMPKTLEQQREDAWRMYIYHSSNTSYWFGVVKELDEKILNKEQNNGF